MYLILLWVLFSQANDPVEQLVGAESKTWTFKKIITISAYRNAPCEQGTVWTFRRNRTVEKLECIERSLVRTLSDWAIETGDELDPTILIGDEAYTLVFPPSDPSDSTEKMFLRKVAPERDQETIDLRFSRPK